MPSLPWTSHATERPLKKLDDQVHAGLADLAMGLSPISLALAQADWAMHLAISPGRQLHLAQQALALSLQGALRGVQGRADAPDHEVPDTRFADPAWQNWPFSALKAGFQASEAWWREAAQVDGMTHHHRHLVDFFARQSLDALSPSNWPWTNPTVLQSGIASGGQTWIKGAQRYLEDWRQLQAQQLCRDPACTEDTLAPLPFAVGHDVAATPGKVVFRNTLIELIQYLPTTEQVHPEPLLIVPSCIMKYYILDLSPENSMVRYLVQQGFTVFILSWRNPEAADRDLGMQDYLQQGVMAALSAVQQRTGAERIHALGYCLGGTFLAIVAALLGGRQRAALSASTPHRRRSDTVPPDALPQLASVTLLAAQTDFSEPGELGVFIDEDQLKTLRESMANTGYLSGKAMGGSFQFLNSRDLVWSRNTRRYLLGQDEVGNDMMSWNADVTRLPERMHSEYLSSLFLNNALAIGHYRVANEGVALINLSAPLLVVGTARDHVSPWRSVYKIHLLTDTHTTFVLAAGGHNAGIVSEPGHPHRSYQMDSVDKGHPWVSPDDWAAQAPRYEGSWWTAMSAWLKERSSPAVPPPAIDPAQVLCDAPGTYVLRRYAD
ncbi:MAG: alpha/beta fold hydrolase [Burkholderiaceae bacterium]|nr:alpha/beta fold hydrolase [Burkholderiaceae bacterium]